MEPTGRNSITLLSPAAATARPLSRYGLVLDSAADKRRESAILSLEDNPDVFEERLRKTASVLNRRSYQEDLPRIQFERRDSIKRMSVAATFRASQQMLRTSQTLVAQEHTEKTAFLQDVADENAFVPEVAEREVCKSINGLTTAEATNLLAKYGPNCLPEKAKPKWLIFLELLYQPMPIMIWLAAAVEAAIENWPDMGILLGIQFLNAFISFYETTKADDAVAALKNSLKPLAVCKRDGAWNPSMDASLLVPGDLIKLNAGAAVPADCFINEGTLDVDQAAMTGESLPVKKYADQAVMMGSIVKDGEVEATVEFTGQSTFIGRTAAMINMATNEVSSLQRVLMHIMLVLVTLSLVLCFTAFGYLLSKGETVKDALSFTVVLIVASIPVAIEIVCTTTLALGSRALSKAGAIVSRLNAIEDMAGMDMLCSDKTGTLTLGEMLLESAESTQQYCFGDNTQESVLRVAALAAKWKEPASDAITTLVLDGLKHRYPQTHASLNFAEQLSYTPFNPTDKRTLAAIREHGEEFRVAKGAPQSIMALDCDPDRVDLVASHTRELAGRGIRTLAVARSEPCDSQADPAVLRWHTVGLLTFSDPARPDTKETIARAKALGVRVKMITGDGRLIACEMARQLDMGDRIEGASNLPVLVDNKAPDDLADHYGSLVEHADGFAEVFPEHKYLVVQCLRDRGWKVGMTGDGVNDAPALKRADVGVAVSPCTDAARAAADIVLTGRGLSVIVLGIEISRQIFQRMKNFITYRIAATMQLLVFFFVAVLAMHPQRYLPNGAPNRNQWPDFFEMPVLLLMLITLLNDGTLISIGYDNVSGSKRPERWNLPVIFTISSVLGAVACGSSLLLLWGALDSWNPDGWFQKWHITSDDSGLAYGQITTLVYLKVSVSDFLTLFSARTQEDFFWTSPPSLILLVAAFFSLALSTILACVWPTGDLGGIAIGPLGKDNAWLPVLVWVYCLLVWLLQDALKVAVHRLLLHYNWFDIRTELRRSAANAACGDKLPADSGPAYENV